MISDFSCGLLLDQLGESGGYFWICQPVISWTLEKSSSLTTLPQKQVGDGC